MSQTRASDIEDLYGPGRPDFVDASLFTSVNDTDQVNPKAPAAGKRREQAQASRSLPWANLPWYKRSFLVPKLFVLVWVDYARRLLLILRWHMRRWLQSRPGALTLTLETLLWPLVFLAFAYWSNPENPLYVDQGFPWPWLGVWLVALRYGALSGAIGTIMLLVWWYLVDLSQGLGDLPHTYFLGGAIMAIIAGEFGSMWGQRANRQREAMRYLDDRIDRLTRRLYLLKLSHDELEFELVERPSTLRDALTELQDKLNVMQDDGTALSGAQQMLDFWAAHGQLESAAIYEVMDAPVPVLIRKAAVGAHTPKQSLDDPTAMRAIEVGHAVHLLDQLSDLTAGDQALAAFPIQDSDDRVRGMLAVFRMPFMAFNADNLRNIGVLVDAYAAWLRLRQISMPLLRAWPQAPHAMLQEYAWLAHMHKAHGVDSGCVVWRSDGPQATLALQWIQKLHENSAMAWKLSPKSVVAISPFLTRKRLNQHVQNVIEAVQKRLSEDGTTHIHAQPLSMIEEKSWTLLQLAAQKRVRTKGDAS